LPSSICLIAAPVTTDFEDPAEANSRAIREAARDPKLGVLALAGALDSSGIQPALLDLDRLYASYLEEDRPGGVLGFPGWAARQIVSCDSPIYGFSSICSSYPLTVRTAECVKRESPGSAILFGGPQASVTDLSTLAAFPFVDFILRGEADFTLPQFVDEWNGGRRFHSVPGLSWRSPFGPQRNPDADVIADLDTLPLPAYHLTRDLDGADAAPLELGRGCPFSCTFCSTNDFFRRKFRLKSPSQMLADMRAIAAQYGIRSFTLVHDMFTVDRHRVAAFCDCMIASGENFTWSCSARTDCVDEELLALMARAGCSGVFFGVEAGSQRMQRIIDKDLDPDRAKSIVETAERLGIPTTVSLITGFPEEDEDDLRATIDVYAHSQRHPQSTPQLSLLAPLSGTPIYSLHKDSLVLDDLCSSLSHQGKRQNQADRELIRSHPAIFPNFYLLPTRLDRARLLELREFLLSGTSRMRWLFVALHQSGSGILHVFDEWRAHRAALHPSLGGGPLRHYYTQEVFDGEFARFLRERLSTFRGSAVPALLDYQEAVLKALASAPAPPPGSAVPGPPLPGDIAIPARHVHVLELEWDIQRVLDALKAGRRPTRAAGRKCYRTAEDSPGSIRLIEIRPRVARALQICAAGCTAEEFARQAAPLFDCPLKLRTCAAESLLAAMRDQGLVEVYRTQPAGERSEPIPRQAKRAVC
jgi:hypothetical protein